MANNEATAATSPVPVIANSGSAAKLASAAVSVLERPWVLSVLLAIILTWSWELVSGTLIDAVWIGSPSGIWVSLVRLVNSGDLWTHGRITLQEAAVGFSFGLVGGSVTGLALGRNAFLSKVFDPYMVALYSTPRLAMAPLFVLWFGIGPEMKYVLVAFSTFFPIFMNSYIGSKDVDKDLLDVLRVMGAGRGTVFFKVILPSTFIWIFAACRLALPHSIGVAVVGEMIVSNKGLGFLALRAAGLFNTSALFAVLLVVVVGGVLLFQVLTVVEARVLRWKATEGKGFI